MIIDAKFITGDGCALEVVPRPKPLGYDNWSEGDRRRTGIVTVRARQNRLTHTFTRQEAQELRDLLTAAIQEYDR